MQRGVRLKGAVRAADACGMTPCVAVALVLACLAASVLVALALGALLVVDRRLVAAEVVDLRPEGRCGP